MGNSNVYLTGLFAIFGAVFSMSAFSQTFSQTDSNESAGDNSDSAMTATPSADVLRRPMLASPPAPDQGIGAAPGEPQIQPADPVGDALRIMTPFSPAAQIPNDAAGGNASRSLPSSGGGGVLPAEGLEGQ